jgi:hypothetical protein
MTKLEVAVDDAKELSSGCDYGQKVTVENAYG